MNLEKEKTMNNILKYIPRERIFDSLSNEDVNDYLTEYGIFYPMAKLVDTFNRVYQRPLTEFFEIVDWDNFDGRDSYFYYVNDYGYQLKSFNAKTDGDIETFKKNLVVDSFITEINSLNLKDEYRLDRFQEGIPDGMANLLDQILVAIQQDTELDTSWANEQ